jgi:hypothetical protein
MAGDGVVDRIAQEFRNEFQRGCQRTPRHPKSAEHVKDSVGAGEQRFVWLARVNYYVNCMNAGRIDAVAREDARGKGALQRSEAKSVISVAAQHELHKSVAETANAVVEEDGIGHAARFSLPSGIRQADCFYQKGILDPADFQFSEEKR